MTIIREPSPSRVRNIFICMAVAFCASSSRIAALDKRPPAHEGERRDFDHAGLHAALDHPPVHEIVERVIDRAQVGIDLVAHVAGQKAEPLAGFDRRTRQHQPLDQTLFEQRDRMADREPGLAGAGRAFGEDQLVLAQGAPDSGPAPRCGRARRRACES